MKNRYFKKKFVILGTLLGLIILLGIIRYGVKKQTGVEEELIKTITSQPTKVMVTPPFKMANPGELVWNTDKIEGLKEKLFECNYKIVNIENTTERLAKLLNLNKANSGVKTKWFSDDSGKITVYGDKTERSITYQKDLIRLKPIELKKDMWVSNDLLVAKLVDLWTGLMPAGPNLVVSKISYKLVNGVRFVAEKMEVANIVEIEANWKDNEGEIYGLLGSVIRARFERDGGLVYLKTMIPFDLASKKCDEMEIIDEELIKKLEASKFSIINTSGGKEFDQSSQDELISKMTIDKAEVIYVWDQYQEKMSPMIKIEGNSSLTTGIVIVTAIANIVK